MRHFFILGLCLCALFCLNSCGSTSSAGLDSDDASAQQASTPPSLTVTTMTVNGVVPTGVANPSVKVNGLNATITGSNWTAEIPCPDAPQSIVVELFSNGAKVGESTGTASGDGSLNRAPVATAQTVSVVARQVAHITLRGTDPEGDALTYSIVNRPAAGRLGAIATDGAMTYTAPNTAGTQTFTFRANDGLATSASATVTITVTAAPTGGGGGGGGGTGTATIKGRVVDAVTGSALADVAVSVSRGGAAQTVNSDTNGAFTLVNLPAPGPIALTYTKSGYITTTYSNIRTTSRSSKTIETVQMVDTGHNSSGACDGTVKNAVNAQGISGATIKLVAGVGASNTGTPVATVTSGSTGTWSVTGVEAGSYTAIASKSGFVTNRVTVVIVGDITRHRDIVLSPVGSGGGGGSGANANSCRVVLTWGENPRDLDSHMTGPDSSGARFHVYFIDDVSPDAKCKLDVDDTSSFGPETITVNPKNTGLYRYSVFDYSNQSNASNMALANSGATVTIYMGDSDPDPIIRYVPNQIGTLWTVFEWDGTNITFPDTVTYHNGDSDSVP